MFQPELRSGNRWLAGFPRRAGLRPALDARQPVRPPAQKNTSVFTRNPAAMRHAKAGRRPARRGQPPAFHSSTSEFGLNAKDAKVSAEERREKAASFARLRGNLCVLRVKKSPPENKIRQDSSAEMFSEESLR